MTASRYEAGEDLPAHGHENALFCVVLGGRHTDSIGRRTFERTGNSVFLVSPRVRPQ